MPSNERVKREAIEAIGLMVDLKNAGELEELAVGEHMEVIIRRYRSSRQKHLSDGTIIRPGDKVGEIHFSNDIPELQENENMIGFARRLFVSARESMQHLAQLCQDNYYQTDGVVAFLGQSHIAGPLAKRLGFDIFEIRNPITRLISTELSYVTAKESAYRNPTWQQFRTNFKSAKEAIISRDKLVQTHGNTI